jgi:hypothetical protein
LKKSIAADNGQIKFDELAIKLESMTFTREDVTSHNNPYYDTPQKQGNHWLKMSMMGLQQSSKTSPVNFEHQSLSINVLDPVYLPSITTEKCAVRKRRLVGNIGEI